MSEATVMTIVLGYEILKVVSQNEERNDITSSLAHLAIIISRGCQTTLHQSLDELIFTIQGCVACITTSPHQRRTCG